MGHTGSRTQSQCARAVPARRQVDPVVDRTGMLGDDDKHLNVVVSVHRKVDEGTGAAIVTITTVVHVNNWLGRLYMVPVAPAHRVIAHTMMRAVGNQTMDA